MNDDFSLARYIVCHLTSEPIDIAHVLESPSFKTIEGRLFVCGEKPKFLAGNNSKTRFYIAWESISKFVMFDNEQDLRRYLGDELSPSGN